VKTILAIAACVMVAGLVILGVALLEAMQ